jgi:hypothetical protein
VAMSSSHANCQTAAAWTQLSDGSGAKNFSSLLSTFDRGWASSSQIVTPTRFAEE